MMNKKLNILLIVLTALSLAFGIYTLSARKKMGYYDYNEVYNNCMLKIKLEKDLQHVAATRKSELDSLQLELSFLSEKIQSSNASEKEMQDFENMKNRYLSFQDKYEEENLRLKDAYFNQIRKEINDKSKQYGEMKGYDYLFSATGDGALMYASGSEDITKDFQLFMDKK